MLQTSVGDRVHFQGSNGMTVTTGCEASHALVSLVNSQVPLPVLAEYALPVGLCQMPGPSMGLAAAPPCSYISTTSEGLVSTTVSGLRPRSEGLMRALHSSFSTSVCLAAQPTVLACGQTDLCQQFLGLLATGQVDNIYLQIKPSSHMVLSLLFPPSIFSQEAHWKKPWPPSHLGPK